MSSPPAVPLESPRPGRVVLDWLALVKADTIGIKDITVLNASDTVKKAFETLVNNNILSAPVFDEGKNEFYGLVDIVDIVSFLVDLFGEDHKNSPRSRERSEDSEGTSIPFWSDLLVTQRNFFNTPIKDISDFSKRNPTVTVPATHTLKDVATVLASGVHRVCIEDSEGNMDSLITQGTFVRYIHQNMKMLGKRRFRSMKELGIGEKEVLSIDFRETALSAFRKMHTLKVSALAVIGADGHLLTNISGKDLRALIHQKYAFSKLYLTVLEFLRIVRTEEVMERAPAVSISIGDTLDFVINKLATTGLHRLFVEDEHRNLRGVVNLTDIIGAIIKP